MLDIIRFLSNGAKGSGVGLEPVAIITFSVVSVSLFAIGSGNLYRVLVYKRAYTGMYIYLVLLHQESDTVYVSLYYVAFPLDHLAEVYLRRGYIDTVFLRNDRAR